MKLRRWFTGLNVLVTVLLLGVLFIFLNFIASRRYARRDFSRTKITAISTRTVQILRQLQNPVHVVVFYQPIHPLYELIQDLLKEYQQESPKLAVEYVDPEQDRARATELVQQFQIDANKDVTQDQINLIIVESGTRHKFLSDADLVERDYNALSPAGQPSLKSFKGEDALSSAILSVTQSTQPVIWFATGHGEKSLDGANALGIAGLKKYLERDNMKVESATLLQQSEIPSSVNAIVMVGPTHRMTEQELLLLQAYLERGGRLLAMIDPKIDSGLDGLLSRWGAELGNDIVVDPARRLPFVSAANLFVTTYTNHPIVEHMETLMTLFPLARSVKPVPDRPGIDASALAMTSPDGWGETHMDTQPFRFEKDSDVPGPVSIAVASERKGTTPTRLVVIGDSDFVANGQVTNVGNLDLVLGAFHWLVGQEQLIGIGPKPLESIKLNLTAAQMMGIFWFSLAAMPGIFAGLGVAMWWLRRK